jgi:hypothetical protein
MAKDKKVPVGIKSNLITRNEKLKAPKKGKK